jgi:hypothetical protein
MNRIEREIKTVGIMINMFCRHRHRSDKLCGSCQELLDYARQRTLKCPLGEDKLVCAKCQIHCYNPEMRVKVKEVMKFSGPKMISVHPMRAIRHFMAARKEGPMIKK